MESLTDNNILDEIAALTARIECNPNDDEAYFQRGKLYWKIGQTGAAMSDYEAAALINSDSPATEALRMSRDIMNFYNTDLYNP